MNGNKITWTPEMDEIIINRFPCEFTRDLSKELGVSMRSVIRRARALNIEKEPGFLESRKEVIQRMSIEAHPPHPHKGEKGWFVPNSEKTRFQKGHVPASRTNPEVMKKAWQTRRIFIAENPELTKKAWKTRYENIMKNIPKEKDLIRRLSSGKFDHLVTRTSVKPLERTEKHSREFHKDLEKEFYVRIF